MWEGDWGKMWKVASGCYMLADFYFVSPSICEWGRGCGSSN